MNRDPIKFSNQNNQIQLSLLGRYGKPLENEFRYSSILLEQLFPLDRRDIRQADM